MCSNSQRPTRCLSAVCPSVRSSKLVRAITVERTELESSNLVYKCILGSCRTVLYMVVFDLDLQGHLGLKRSKSAQNGLVRVITHHALDLGSQNLHQMCITEPSRSLLKMVLIDLDLQGHLGLKRPKSAQNGLVTAITHHVYKLGSPNLRQTCILGPSRTLLKMVLIALDLQGHLDTLALIQTTTHKAYIHTSTHTERGTRHISCSLCRSRMELLYIVQFDIDLQGHFGVILTISLNVNIG